LAVVTIPDTARALAVRAVVAVRGNWRRPAVGAGALVVAVLLFELRHVAAGVVVAVALYPVLFATALTYFGAVERDRAAQQRFRELAVLSRLPAMRSGAEPFFLYLRPFASTGGVRVLRRVAKRKRARSSYFGSDPRFNPGPGYQYKLVAVWNDLETLLEAALRAYGPLVALGRPGEQLGAARIPSDEASWKELVEELMRQARLIFLLPSDDAGTAWELSLLRTDRALLRKTVFVVPGSSDEQDWIDAGPRSTGRRSDLRAGPLTYGVEHPTGGARPTSSFDPARRPEPERSGELLRRDALEALRRFGAREAARSAEAHPSLVLVTLHEHLAVERLDALRGHRTEWSLNPLDVGPVFSLDLDDFRGAVTARLVGRGSEADLARSAGPRRAVDVGLADDSSVDEHDPWVAAFRRLGGRRRR
jgi:hypothetical protein